MSAAAIRTGADRTLELLTRQVGRSLSEVETPVAVVDLDRLDANLRDLQSYADAHGIAPALHGIGRSRASARAAHVLEKFALADRIDDKVRNLSGGQMRRLEIARALIHDPALLLLDEPTVGLDVEARQGLIMEVRRLVAEEGRGILWATHLLDEIEMSDRLVVLHKGRVLAQGSVQDVLAEAGDTDLQTAFLKLVNAPGTTSAGREAAE